MKLKALRNILVAGEHIGEGDLFDADTDTATALLATKKVERVAEKSAAKKSAKDTE